MKLFRASRKVQLKVTAVLDLSLSVWRLGRAGQERGGRGGVCQIVISAGGEERDGSYLLSQFLQ